MFLIKNSAKTIENPFHLQGEQAFHIYREQVYHCKPRFSSIMAIDMNLEILVDEEGKLLAFRNYHPDDMQGMVLNVGHWQYHQEEEISPEVRTEIRTLMVGLCYEICRN